MRRANLRIRNAALVTVLLGVVAGMLGLTYASVPLYRLFCQVTGFGGYTHRADAAPAAVPGSLITIRFDANVNGTLPWTFAPEQREISLALGESGTAVYRAKNLSSQRMIGQAIFNVTPFEAAPYFNKIQCFCFQEQPLAPGESAELPVTFFVDPKIADNPNTAGIRTITLSYTFFRATDDEAAAKKVSKTEAKTNTVN